MIICHYWSLVYYQESRAILIFHHVLVMILLLNVCGRQRFFVIAFLTIVWFCIQWNLSMIYNIADTLGTTESVLIR